MKKLSNSLYKSVFTGLLLSGGSLVKGEYIGVASVWDEGVDGASILIWEWRGWKRDWEKVDGLVSESANSSGVSMSELSYWKIVLYIVIVELVSLINC